MERRGERVCVCACVTEGETDMPLGIPTWADRVPFAAGRGIDGSWIHWLTGRGLSDGSREDVDGEVSARREVQW